MKRFIEGLDRSQTTLLPECIDDYVDEDWTSPDLVESHSLLVLSGSECSFEGCRTDVA
jgi:hypothetical protein